jgi:hypothetical protein
MEQIRFTAPDTSWLNGKYENGEINTRLPYVSINNFFGKGEECNYFVQGEDADEVIREIHSIWTSDELTVEEAIEKFKDLYGYV